MARQRVWKRNKIDFSRQMQTCVPLQIQILCVPLKLEKWVPLRDILGQRILLQRAS